MLYNMNYIDYENQNNNRKLELQKMETKLANARLSEQTRLYK